MITQTLKTSPKTASRALFLRGKGHLNPKNAKKTSKTPPAVTYRGFFCEKKFTGKEPDPETGLYYYGARYLDPKTSRWISGDPALGEYLPVAPVNDEAKKRNGNLPGMGGIFNTVNMHVYHYAGNNPVKYVDPDGEQQFPGLYGPRDYFDFLDFIGDPFARLLNLFRRADNGDQSAKTLLGMMWHEAGRDTLKEISDGSSIATLAFLAFGVPEGAAVASGVGLVADGLLVLDDIISGNYGDAIADGTILVAGIIIKKQVGKLVEGVGNRAVSISVGKNGRYYELGRRGALNTKDALRALVAADIANGIFGNLAPEVASQLLKEANKAIEEL
jgi:RHS repeat-associated protein